MGLDGTLKRADGHPLGDLAFVQQALAVAFPGIVTGKLPSGTEKLRMMMDRGIDVPEILRKHLESSPANNGAEFEGPEFSAQLNLGPFDLVENITFTLYGKTVASEPMFEILKAQFDWIETFP